MKFPSGKRIHEYSEELANLDLRDKSWSGYVPFEEWSTRGVVYAAILSFSFSSELKADDYTDMKVSIRACRLICDKIIKGLYD
jgi:hypothetical protein